MTNWDILSRGLPDLGNNPKKKVSGFASGGSDAVYEKFMRATCKRDVIVGKRRIFLEKSQGIVIERDVTPDKLKNACTFANRFAKIQRV